MVNVLIVDANNQSGALVKSILRGKNYGVSISTDYHEALNKLDTGLFDLICLDTEDSSYPKFLKSLKTTYPFLPVIALTEKPVLEMEEVFSYVSKPLNLTNFIKAIQEGIEYLKSIDQKQIHRSVSLEVDLNANQEKIKCRITELSLKGAWVEPEDNAHETFTNFFSKKLGKIITSIRQKEKELVKIVSRLIYTESSSRFLVRRAGLGFLELSSQETAILKSLITCVS